MPIMFTNHEIRFSKNAAAKTGTVFENCTMSIDVISSVNEDGSCTGNRLHFRGGKIAGSNFKFQMKHSGEAVYHDQSGIFFWNRLGEKVEITWAQITAQSLIAFRRAGREGDLFIPDPSKRKNAAQEELALASAEAMDSLVNDLDVPAEDAAEAAAQ